MIRSFFVLALLAHGGLAMAQPGANPANPFDQGGRRTTPAAAARVPARNAIAQAEEAVQLRHYEKMLEMKLDMELQLEFAQVGKGSEAQEIEHLKKRLVVLSKRLQDTKAQLEEKNRVRQDELLKQQQQLQQQLQQRRNEDPRNNRNGQTDERRLERVPLMRIAADDAARAIQNFASQNQKKIQNLSIQTDARTNSLVIYGSDNDLIAAKDIIKDLDKAPKDEKAPEKPK